ncbi:hypothetical protein VIGAN_04223500 [Vigna angularis var. angularis]|uniref:Uncharacterized protein n=1 Tax=Vigna angularis var. angularis TaxID=157739 RepID=A0A0S3RW14_PHAAN|nr:hypothetical protein VIGAN_04223500 [Vigna angularis var. angularis]
MGHNNYLSLLKKVLTLQNIHVYLKSKHCYIVFTPKLHYSLCSRLSCYYSFPLGKYDCSLSRRDTELSGTGIISSTCCTTIKAVHKA